MMSILRNLFPSKEVKIVIAAGNKLLDEIQEEYKDSYTFSEDYALREIKSNLKSYIKKKYILVAYLIHEENILPERIALDFTCKCVSDNLKSGYCTDYTHSLNYIGEGIYKIYVSLLNKYEANGIQTPQQNKILLEEIKVKIRTAPYKSPKNIFDFILPKPNH